MTLVQDNRTPRDPNGPVGAPQDPTTPTGTPLTRNRRWVALAVLMLPVLLVSIDNTVLTFALPQISEALRPTGTQLLWMIDIYPLVLAGLLVSMGSFADRIGRRRLLLVGAVGFALLSVVAAYAPSAEALIASRAGLGFFGAMIMPPTLSLLRNIFTDREERRLAIAIWAAGFAAGNAIGPIAGGFLLEHAWWGSVFLLAVPVLVLLLALAPVFVPESKDSNPGRVDVVSIVLSMATMAPIVLGIKTLAKFGPGALALGALVLGLVAGWVFVRRQLGRPDPMIDVRLFRRGEFSGAVVINLLSVFSLVGFLFFVSQDVQLVLGLSPMKAGYALLPGLVAMVVAGLLVVRVVRRVRPSHVVAVAILFAAAGYAMVALTAGSSTLTGLVVAFVVLAIGIGAAETVSNDLIVSAVPADKAGAASAISETAYEVGAVLGTAVLGSILTGSYHRNVVVPDGVPPTDAAAAAETLGGATQVAQTLPTDQAQALLSSAHEAFGSGVGTTSWIGFGLMLVASVIALVALRPARS